MKQSFPTHPHIAKGGLFAAVRVIISLEETVLTHFMKLLCSISMPSPV